MKKKIAFVCHRYGLEVNGGAELYCREVAEHLAEKYDITVYTTCAIDYATWANEYQPGESVINGIRVKRYPAERERIRESFDQIHGYILTSPVHTDRDEQRWIEEQGPVCPALIDAVREEADRYSVVFFMTYLYYPAIRGMGLHLPHAILIPTVHDEPMVHFRCYDDVFYSAAAIVWNTPEERAFAYGRFPGLEKIPSEMTGIGIEPPAGELPEIPERIRGKKYLVYAGRIDESKGCREMFDYYLAYKRRCGNDLKLVLMGKAMIEIPQDPDIIDLGFVSEEMKFAVMKQAYALVLFSRFESLSMVVLESMLMERPVLVTEKCEVLKGHCIRSGAGLYFRSFAEFAEGLNYLEKHPDVYQQMRINGKRYVEENYRWNRITDKYSALIELTDRHSGSGRETRERGPAGKRAGS